MKPYFLVLLLIFFFPALLNAENPDSELLKNERPVMICINLGYSFSGYRDEVESDMNRYMNTLSYMLKTSIEKGSFLHLINFNFLLGSPRRYAPHKGYNHNPSSSGSRWVMVISHMRRISSRAS